MPDAVWANAFHNAPVTAPMLWKCAHSVVTHVVNCAIFPSTLITAVHSYEHFFAMLKLVTVHWSPLARAVRAIQRMSSIVPTPTGW